MDNVLDLKNPAGNEERSGSTTDVTTPVQALAVSRGEFLGADEASLDDLTDLILSQTAMPREISWQADHALQGAAVRKHYYLLGSLAAVGGLVALWQASLSAFIAVLAGIGALEARQRWSKSVRVDIDEQGVSIDGQRYPHTDVASFDIHTMPDGATELSLRSGRWNNPHMRLPLGDQDPDSVRAVLAQYIPEDRHSIPLLDYLIRKP